MVAWWLIILDDRPAWWLIVLDDRPAWSEDDLVWWCRETVWYTSSPSPSMMLICEGVLYMTFLERTGSLVGFRLYALFVCLIMMSGWKTKPGRALVGRVG
ncbi:hypothetical protein LR48_Vigan01g151600 [Vigna angularis]|uniref:Uncharacterized protein n=1 Tax=Phaseolus angularis TaxID=3914 RepID=A0A0L9TN47_PHAAN|nr:hypothetical protein LR48_Vigan01g151600 [Vigna angularis]